MRVLIINTSERIGGAAIAAHRLMEEWYKSQDACPRQAD